MKVYIHLKGLGMKIKYDEIFQALKRYYEVEDDASVREILDQSDDCINDICEALNMEGEHEVLYHGR